MAKRFHRNFEEFQPKRLPSILGLEIMKPSRSLFESLPSHISINSSFLYRLEHYIQKATLVNTSKIRSEPTVASILLEIVFHEPASFNPLRNYFRI